MADKHEKIVYYPIYHNSRYPGAERSDDVKKWVERILIPQGRASYDIKKTNCILGATGDSGIMHIARQFYDIEPIIFGVARGSYNFMLNDISAINEIPRDFSEIEKVPLKLMEALFYQKNGKITKFFAFNDVVIGRDVNDMVMFKVTGTRKEFPNHIVSGTGMIIATPQGSTGYALKASRNSSVVLHLDYPLWLIQGLATGFFPSEHVDPQKIVIEIESRFKIHGSADGQSQKAEDIYKVVVVPTEYVVNLAFLKSNNFHLKRMLKAREILQNYISVIEGKEYIIYK